MASASERVGGGFSALRDAIEDGDVEVAVGDGIGIIGPQHLGDGEVRLTSGEVALPR
jgi:hypothetical protein